ncbi:hypothetical protein HSB1_16700 [Halogranum salarium B-1]|uniref:Uncharacterized protein n=1 Tax=Halogranum salarium B-1 TaxID=1210908 RepID=J3EWY1_9EURY|nr:hypothetical protein HSB1_16700 [Halogranum salarium B-1]
MGASVTGSRHCSLNSLRLAYRVVRLDERCDSRSRPKK